jgi:thioredoxin reductase
VKEGYKKTIEANSIVPAIPMKPNTELFQSFQGKAPEVYAIGDCSNPRLIVDAIADGWRIANSI